MIRLGQGWMYTEFKRDDLKIVFNNYSPKAKWILVNIYPDEVEVDIYQYSLSLRRIINIIYITTQVNVRESGKV
jgi:hypothetical protein